MHTTKPFWWLLFGLVGLLLGGCQPADPVQATTKSAAGANAAAPQPKFHCPMHPTYVSDRMGDCPICNMKLVPIKADGAAPAAAPAGAASVPGRTPIALTAEKRQLIGLTLKTVEVRDLALTVRAPAVVEHDERRYARIAPRVGGWIRRLDVDFTNAPVQAGQRLFTYYSPEVFATQNDYLIAWRALRALPAEASPAERQAAQALLDAARLRLELWEVGAAELRAIEARGTPSAEIAFVAPIGGHVLAKNAVAGRAFMAGDTLFEIADLAHLWLQVRVAENDLPRLAVGQEATITFPSLSNLVTSAPVTFLDPHLDPQTRRGTARIDLENLQGQLRPEMWAEAEIEIPLGKKLTVPADAVIDTGRRQFVFVATEHDHLEPRLVQIGAKTDEFWEVRAGLQAGDRVVSRALFLVDAESQLRAAIAGMTSGGEGHQH